MSIHSPFKESTLFSEKPDEHTTQSDTKFCTPSQARSGGCSYSHSPFLSLLSFLPLSLSLPLSSPRSILCNSFRSCSSLSRESWELVFLFCNIFSIFFPISSKSLSSAELLSVSVDRISVDSRTLKQEASWKSVSRVPPPKKISLLPSQKYKGKNHIKVWKLMLQITIKRIGIIYSLLSPPVIPMSKRSIVPSQSSPMRWSLHHKQYYIPSPLSCLGPEQGIMHEFFWQL